MKEPIIKRKHKSKNIFKEEVRKIPVKDRPNIKLSTIKGNGPNGQLTARQIDHLIKAYNMQQIVWLENTNERLWETLKFQQRKILHYEESIEFMLTEFELNTEDLTKRYYEVIRSYNALVEFNKLAEELGVDMDKHRMQLPENQKYMKAKDYDFVAKQEVLESGKIRNVLQLKPKPQLREQFKKEWEERKRKMEEGKNKNK